MRPVIAYITTKDEAEAKKIGRDLLEKRLAACVNIFASMQSMYWWEGKINESKEAVLLAKTDSSKVDALIEAVKKSHSYTVPCVLTFPVEKGNPDYIRWLEQSLK